MMVIVSANEQIARETTSHSMRINSNPCYYKVISVENTFAKSNVEFVQIFNHKLNSNKANEERAISLASYDCFCETNVSHCDCYG